MIRAPGAPASAPGWAMLRPWPVLVLGLLLLGVGVGLAALPLPALRLACVGVGVLTVGAAVQRRLRSADWDLLPRLETAGLLLLAGAGAVLAYFGMDRSWDSGRMLFAAATLLAVTGALLVALPRRARHVLLSAIVLFHFGGMLTAVTSVGPPGGPGPWLPRQLWTRVYRPYLSFLYMSNAYHFYSPDPGPPTLLWFAVHYTDGKYQWVRLPDRDSSPVGMYYQRMLALPVHTFQPGKRPPTRQELLELTQQTGIPPQRESWEDIVARRVRGSQRPYPDPIPVVLDMAPFMPDRDPQYREPTDFSKILIASAARHVFWTAPSRPGAEVRSVKVYTVIHIVISPAELAAGVSPLQKHKYLPYFMGEFNGKGELIDPHEPFLYWYLPVVVVPLDYPECCPCPPLPPFVADAVPGAPAIRVRALPKPGRWLDCLESHAAGSSPPARKPQRAKP